MPSQSLFWVKFHLTGFPFLRHSARMDKNKSVSLESNPLRIDQIDYAASTVLTQREGHCVAASHGLHSVRKGEAVCCKCGAR